MFTTAFVGVLNPVSHLLEYCNAGQSPVIYLSAGGEAQLLEAHDIPIGIFDGFDYSSFSLALAPGDVFVVASDGFPEACNHAGEMFGYARMQEVLNGCRQLSARAMSDRLFGAIEVFSEGQFQSDDQTIILIKILNVPPSTLVIPATYENVGMVDESLRAMLLKAMVPEPTIAICELAFHELLTNLVDHAYQGDARGEIRVFLSVEPARIIMETRDQGKAVALDLTEIRMPDPLELAESGYGLAIIQSQMDVMEYRIEDGQNVWRLVKNRT